MLRRLACLAEQSSELQHSSSQHHTAPKATKLSSAAGYADNAAASNASALLAAASRSGALLFNLRYEGLPVTSASASNIKASHAAAPPYASESCPSLHRVWAWLLEHLAQRFWGF
jgi:hypothetical protein